MQLRQQEPRAPRTLGAPSARPWAPIVAVIALTATIGTIVLARALAPSQPDAEDLAEVRPTVSSTAIWSRTAESSGAIKVGTR
jgi:hypothetical protein